MPFKINNKVIPLDTPFTTEDGIQRPANWIRLATEEDKAAIGLVWEADSVRADDRFYWNGDVNSPKALEDKEEVDQDGKPLYVQKYNPVTEKMENTTKRLVTKGLKSVFKDQVRNSAYLILLQTDWAVVRKAERAIEIPADITTYRADVLATLDDLESAIAGVTTVEELAALNLSFPNKE